jgi:hypothetical protein
MGLGTQNATSVQFVFLFFYILRWYYFEYFTSYYKRITIFIMKHFFLSTCFLLAVLLLSGVSNNCLAQETGHFQGNVKANITHVGIFWDQHYTADICLGWRFNEKQFLGVGTGYHWLKPFARGENHSIVDVDYVPAIPVFADFTRYFPSSKRPGNSFYLGLEGGAAWFLKPLPSESRHPEDKIVPYLNGKMGYDFGISDRLGLSVGLNLIWGCGHGFSLSSEGGHGLAATLGLRF